MKVAFYTLGCKVNQYDTQTMESLFQAEGWDVVPFGEQADATVINTCTVTAMSDKKSRQMISRAHRFSPAGIIVVSGCYAQRDAKNVLALPGVSVVLGNRNRSSVVELARRALFDGEKIDAVEDIMQARQFEELPALCEERTRATLKIQDGCNRFCSYCIIPYARGPIRSRAPEEVEAEVERLSAQGFAEFVLTGIHLASYGRDNGSSLREIIERVGEIPAVRRIRLGSLEPSILTEEFCASCGANEKLCRQFHVSMQSGSETVLRRMNRRYTPEEYAAYIENIRKFMPEAAITTDVIAGFCEETEQEHRETLAFVERIGFARIHVFPYSRREGTKAASMGDLPSSVKEARTAELIALGKRLEDAYIDRALGTVQEVLLEEPDAQGRMCGYTGTYLHTAVPGGERGDIVRVRLLSREGETVLGEILEKA